MAFAGTQRFEIVRRLGEGGTGVVYEAIDREGGARLALKTLRDPEPQALYRLKREFRSLADLRHPNLVSLGELYEDRGHWFFTMELVEGSDLIQYLTGIDAERRAALGEAETQRLPRVDPAATPAAPMVGFDPPRLRDAFAQLTEAVAVLHQASKIHRDIKPSNVLVTEAGRVVLLDFGLVAELEREEQSQDGVLVGTAAYMAPEQAAGRRVGPEADWYSVGVLLYEALTGRPPFVGPTLKVLVDKQQARPVPVDRVNPRVPPDLAALCTGLLSFEPERRPRADEIAKRLRGVVVPAPTRLGSSTQSASFVGRRRELEALQAGYDEMTAGGTVGLVVRGESGVGKTALVRRLVHSLGDRTPPPIVLQGRCYQSETVPFKALDGVIDSLSRLLRRLDEVEVAGLLPREASLLPRVFPVLGRVPQIARAPRSRRFEKDVKLRTRVFGALRELFQRLAAWRPLVVTIDDLQWADADSVRLLRALVVPPDPPPLLLLATLREQAGKDGGRALEALELPGSFRSLDLGHLDPADARELAALLLERVGAQDAAPERIAREAGGHPLYIDELVRHISAAEDDRVSIRLDQAIWQRISAQAPAARRVVEAVAVAAAPLPAEVIREAAGQEADEFRRLIGILRVTNLIRAAAGRDGEAIEPYHDRVREAVIANLPPAELSARHQGLATAIERTGLAERLPELLVLHLEGAGEPERAAEYAERAAARATALLAFERAAALYRTALRIGAAEPAQRRRLQRALGTALVNAGRCEQAAQALLAGGEDDDRSIRLECHIQAAEQFLISGHIERGTAVLATLLGEMGIAMPRSPGQALRALLWRRFQLRLRGYRWRSRTPAQIAPEQLLRVDLLKAISNGMSMVDNITGAEFNSSFLLAALRAGEDTRVAAALAAEAVYVSSQGGRGFARGRKIAVILGQMATRSGNPFLDVYASILDAVVDYFAGEFQHALGKLRRLVVSLEKSPVAAIFEVNNSRLFWCFTLRHMGGFVEARRLLAEYVDDAVARGDRYLETSLRRTGTMVCLAADDPAAARDHLARATWVPPENRFHTQHWYELEALGELALYEERAAEARVELAPMFEKLWASMISRVQIVRVLARWLEGRLLLAGSDDPADQARVTWLARRLGREKVPYARVWSGFLRAGLLEAQGQHERAAAELVPAIALARSKGMHGAVAAATMRRAELLGGAEAEPLRVSAAAFFAEQEVRAPERLVQIYLPRFERGRVGADRSGGGGDGGTSSGRR